MLAFLSRKNWLEKGRVPFIAKRRHAAKGESRVWAAVLARVLKRPLLSTVIAGGLLVALSIPALGMQFKNPGFDGYSRSQPVIQTLRSSPGRLPRRRRARHDRRSRPQDVTAAPGPGRDRPAARPRAGHRAALRALARRDQPRQDRRRRRPLDQGQRHRRRLRALARDAALARSFPPPSAGWPAPRSP